LISGERIFPLNSDIAVQKLGLFRTAPPRLDPIEYKVTTAVPQDVFDAFVKMVEGAPFAITKNNCRSLADVSVEFDFAELSAACEDFSRSGLQLGVCESSAVVDRLLSRLQLLEERQH
jgi:hypothetical protein